MDDMKLGLVEARFAEIVEQRTDDHPGAGKTVRTGTKLESYNHLYGIEKAM